MTLMIKMMTGMELGGRIVLTIRMIMSSVRHSDSVEDNDGDES